FLYAQANNSRDTDALKEVRVVRIQDAPLIDGRLDEAVWQQAEVITDFHQTRPGDGTEPSETTEVYMLYTEDALYIGARMYDSEPHLIAAPTIRHGQGLGGDDRLVVILDPFNTRRVGYRFETNLNGVRHDALYTEVSSFQSDWTVIWDTATSVEEDAWVAEIEIPFKTLPFDENVSTWGFNFGRGIRRRGEEVAWVSYNRSYNPSIVGLATGLTGMDKGVGLDLVPSVAVNREKRFANATNPVNISNTQWDPYLDAFYRNTPSLNAALTINTDFSATEVDNRQVNLTRFNLFFPEKRDFFLNDSDLFQFGGIGSGGFRSGNQAQSQGSRQNARPYFSRRIGLSASGSPVDIEYGGRLSGRLGRWNIGTLAIRQDEFGGIGAKDLFVGRYSVNVLEESTLGVILTDGNPRANEDNSVMGVDFKYLNTRLEGGQTIEGDLWYQQSDTPGLIDNDASFGFGLRSPNSSGLSGGIGFKEVQENFFPAMGFVNNTNIRDYVANVGYQEYLDSDWLQSVGFGMDWQKVNVIDGGLQSEAMVFTLLSAETQQGDRSTVRHNRYKEVVQAPFTIYSDPDRSVQIQPGSYEFDNTGAFFGTASQRESSGQILYERGDFYNGTRTTINGGVTWQQSRNFVLDMDYNWNDIELPQGNFISRLTSVTTQVAFSSTLYWVSLIQYDNQSEEIGVNTRLQWIPRAGQEGFIVLNYNVQDLDRDNRFHSAYSDLAIKFKYTIRF
ncbi:MAG: sugar-binding protein, partial [Gammaproteobacteria bacterium]